MSAATMVWTPVTTALPECEPDSGLLRWRDSVVVLATDGVMQRVAHVRYRNADADGKQEPPTWVLVGCAEPASVPQVMAGRDGRIFENVTHWCPLPETPA